MTHDELKLMLEALEEHHYGVAQIIIREALAQPEQEPVAYINVEQRKLEWAKYMTWDTPTVVNLPKIPLYTSPPQRTWVGLTDEQMETTHWSPDFRAGAKWAEAKLEDKNT